MIIADFGGVFAKGALSPELTGRKCAGAMGKPAPLARQCALKLGLFVKYSGCFL